MQGEKQADLEALTREYLDHYQPATPTERSLLDDLIHSEWLKRRFREMETQILDRAMDSAYKPDDLNPIGQAYEDSSAVFARLQRRIDSTDRLYHRALAALQKLQNEREERKLHSQRTTTARKQPASEKLASFGQLPFEPHSEPLDEADPPAPADLLITPTS